MYRAVLTCRRRGRSWGLEEGGSGSETGGEIGGGGGGVSAATCLQIITQHSSEWPNRESHPVIFFSLPPVLHADALSECYSALPAQPPDYTHHHHHHRKGSVLCTTKPTGRRSSIAKRNAFKNSIKKTHTKTHNLFRFLDTLATFSSFHCRCNEYEDHAFPDVHNALSSTFAVCDTQIRCV